MYGAGDVIRARRIPGWRCPLVSSIHALAGSAAKIGRAPFCVSVPIDSNGQNMDSTIAGIIHKGNGAAFGERERIGAKIAWTHRQVIRRAWSSAGSTEAVTGRQQNTEQGQNSEQSQLLQTPTFLSLE